MKEITLCALPPYLEKCCQKFDDFWNTLSKKNGFPDYLAQLLGESQQKNIAQITGTSVYIVIKL